MTSKANSAEHIAAAREHTVTSRRRTRAHVLITHNLDAQSRSLLELFQLGQRVDPELCVALARELAQDIIQDAELLMRELEGIRAFAERQLARLPTNFRE